MNLEKWQIRISLLTLVLTPIASASVVYFQLEKSHSYWIKQQRYIYEEKLSERKFELYEKFAEEFGRLNLFLMNQQVFLFSRNKCEYFLHYAKYKANENDNYIKSERERYKALIIENNTRINESLAKISAYCYLGKVYFGEQFVKEALILTTVIKKSQDQVISVEDMINISKESIKKKQSPDEKINQLFDERANALHLNENMSKFLNFIFEKVKDKY